MVFLIQYPAQSVRQNEYPKSTDHNWSTKNQIMDRTTDTCIIRVLGGSRTKLWGGGEFWKCANEQNLGGGGVMWQRCQ